MPPFIATLTSRWAAPDAVGLRGALRIALIAAAHAAALTLMLWSEAGVVPKLVFCLVWGLFNFFWLAVLRRPALSAALSLVLIVVLILLSRLKYEIIWMTINFLDLMIVNADTVSFLLSVKPDLFRQVLLALALGLPALALLWWVGTSRVRRPGALTGLAAGACGLAGAV